MDSRKVKICYFLAQNKNVLLSEISKKFSKSERTIRNDIEDINIFLNKNKTSKIIIENNLVNFEASSAHIFNLLNNLSYSEYYLDSVERRVIIILFGLLKEHYFTINELSEFMYVSRTTVINDLDSIKKFISGYNYNVVTEPSTGTLIKENLNSKKNDLIKDLIDFDINNISRFFKQKSLSERLNKKLSSSYIKNISDLIIWVEKESDVSLTSYSFRVLKYYIAIYILTLGTNYERKIKNDLEDFVEVLIKRIIDCYDISFSNNDYKNFRRFISKLNFTDKIYDSKDKLKAQIVTDQFIEVISNELNIDFTKDDELLKNLSNHLSDIIDNPIIKIKEYSNISEYTDKFPEFKEIVINSLYILKNFIGRDLNDIEINFIVIYFVAALERMKNLVTNIKILLVCAHGISTSFLVKENLKSIIPNCDIELTNSQNYLTRRNIYNPDLIFSTVKIDEKIDYLLINPVLDFDSTSSIIKEIDRIKMKKILNSKKEYNHSLKNNIEEEGRPLSEILSIDRIKFDVNVENWREAIKKSAEALINEKIIETRYIDAMIENVEKFGPYIKISPGIALPHASSENGVNKTGMSLIKLKYPVKFEEKDDEIYFFICLASKNNEHFNAFISLINGLRNENLRKKFYAAKNKEKMYRIILEMENREDFGGN